MTSAIQTSLSEYLAEQVAIVDGALERAFRPRARSRIQSIVRCATVCLPAENGFVRSLQLLPRRLSLSMSKALQMLRQRSN